MIKNNSANMKIIKMMGTIFLPLSITVPLLKAGETGKNSSNKKTKGEGGWYGYHCGGEGGYHKRRYWHGGGTQSQQHAWSKLTTDEKELFGWSKLLQQNGMKAVLAYLNKQYPESVNNMKAIAQKDTLWSGECRRIDPTACRMRLNETKNPTTHNNWCRWFLSC